MPVSAPSVCPYCTKAHRKAEPCDTVQRMERERKARFDKKRPNSSQRGYDRAWEAEAKAYLSHPLNRTCGCGAPAVVVAHIRSIRSRPDLRMDQTNWRPSCQRCNQFDAARERRAMKG